jgi:hypothetical protein
VRDKNDDVMGQCAQARDKMGEGDDIMGQCTHDVINLILDEGK